MKMILRCGKNMLYAMNILLHDVLALKDYFVIKVALNYCKCNL